MTLGKYKYLFLCLFACLACFKGGLAAEPGRESELLGAMQARLPELMELKLSGEVGEANDGLVKAREALNDDGRTLLADENGDRMAYYNILARRFEVSLQRVQQKRAEQIRRDSPDGVWLQSLDGDWYRK